MCDPEDDGGKKRKDKSRAEVSKLNVHNRTAREKILAEIREPGTENCFIVSSQLRYGKRRPRR